MNERSEILMDQIQRVANCFATVERKLIFEHKGSKLFASEIHFMQAVDGEPELNLTEVAQKLAITKGAASQTLARLQTKGMIGKESDPFNKNQLQMQLTKQGREALQAFYKKIQQEWGELSQYLDSLNQKEIQTVGKFMSRLEDFFRSMG
jgi:DNA-binding MarR family transcriptional regulator